MTDHELRTKGGSPPRPTSSFDRLASEAGWVAAVQAYLGRPAV
jgi:hypothetical protein